jgi:hypothetical protein
VQKTNGYWRIAIDNHNVNQVVTRIAVAVLVVSPFVVQISTSFVPSVSYCS